MSTKPSVVFLGSGPVAAKSLELLSSYVHIEAVITKPRATHHRGAVPVLDLAEKQQFKIHTVSSKQELDTLIEQKPFTSHLAVLIDFGIIVSAKTIAAFPLGIINSHFSLLPEWRGADPITFAILSGQSITGVSLMLLVEEMDAGPLIGQATYDIADKCTTPELTEHLIELSDALLQELLPRYLRAELIISPQEVMTQAVSDKPSYSRKLTKSDGAIDWSKSAVQLEREIRAYLGWPGSRTVLKSQEVIITKAYSIPTIAADGKPGDVELIKEAGTIVVVTGHGSLCIERLKPASRNEMSAAAWIAGLK